MTKQDFTSATHFIPTNEEWERIKKEMGNSDLSDTKFCNIFRLNLRFGTLKDEILAWRLNRIKELEDIIDRMSQKTAEEDRTSERLLYEMLCKYSKAENEADDYRREIKAIEKAMDRIFADTEDYDIVLSSIEKILEEYENERRLRSNDTFTDFEAD